MESKSDTPETPVEKEITPETEVDLSPSDEKAHENHSNNHAKRGRLITSALLVAIALTLISVLVAGIFELTGRLLRECPKELRVNDPAPLLWNDVTAAKPVSVGLGVPKKLEKETMLKPSSSGPQ